MKKRLDNYHELDIPTEQLPSWMRRARQSVDWGILLVILFSLTAAWGFVLQDSVSHHHAGENAVYAIAEYSQSFRQGVLYPRWSTSAMGGYGAPIYNFYPPALSYLGGVVDVLFVDDPVVALRVVMVSAFLLAGSMCYVLVLRVSGALTAVLASMLYLYSPYINLTAPHILGDYNGVLLFALYPMALWNLNRLLTFRNPFDLALGAGIYAGIILTDPAGFYVAVLLAIPMLIWWRWQSQESGRHFFGGMMRFMIAGALGVGITAFFWMPALVEWHEMNWLPTGGMSPDYRLTWLGLLSVGDVIDIQEMHPSPTFNLGWGLIASLVVFLGLIGHHRRLIRRYEKLIWHLLYLLFGSGLLLGVMFFSERSIGLFVPIILCLTLGASGLSLWNDLLLRYLRGGLVPISIVMILLLNMSGWIGTRSPAPFGATDDIVRIQYELAGYGNAVLSPDRLIPTHLDPNYMINQGLIDSYQANMPTRIPNLRLSGEKLANLVYANSHADRYVIEARNAVMFDILRAYDPAWRAWLNGETVDLKPNPANGLMQVLIPEVISGQLDIRYTLTPPHLWAWIMAGVVLVILVLRTMMRMLRYINQEQDDDLDYLRDMDARLIGVVGVGFTALILLHASFFPSQTLHAKPGYQLDYFTGLFLSTTDGLELFAYDYIPPTDGYLNEDDIQFELAWRATQPLAEDYDLHVSIWTEDLSEQIQIHDLGDLGDYPTTRWDVGYYVLDPISLSLADLPNGVYQVGLSVLSCDGDCQPEDQEFFFDVRGEFVGDFIFLPFTLTIN